MEKAEMSWLECEDQTELPQWLIQQLKNETSFK